ncbi:hypothetical protein C4573_04820 [Candidatus Woesearchaeota archaeon]|nr:MAG: hypothetical protein C4573_04820 [Candidatus Woesearchaeota archaeon]
MLKNIPKEDVLKVVRQIGPTIPNKIVKQLGGDTFLIGAILSDLANSKLVKITNVKLGGSPFYYAEGQESKLQELYPHLNSKDKETYDLLKKEKVLKDTEQSPLIRVSLRQIKDFAKPVEVTIREKQELFWKFYLVSSDEVKDILKKQYLQKPEAKIEKKEATKQEPDKIIQRVDDRKEEKIEKTAEEKSEEKKPKIEEKKRSVEKAEIKEEQVKIEQKKKIEQKEVQEVIYEVKKAKKESPKEEKGSFTEKLQQYFGKKNIEIAEKTVAKKGEIDFILKVPSAVGFVQYYCKAKDKKKCNEGDLATAFVQGQNKKLPVLFLTTGEISKKAKEMLEQEFKGMIANSI